jgi:hypothetical protein
VPLFCFIELNMGIKLVDKPIPIKEKITPGIVHDIR